MPEPVFYVTSTIGDRTGGPECAHQLIDAIQARGFEAFMVPLRNFRGRVPDEEYSIYRYDLANKVEKTPSSILVSAEVSPIESFSDFRRVPENRTWMWWLSVHNNPDPRARYFRGSDACCVTLPRPDGVPREKLDVQPSQGYKKRIMSFADANTWPLIREAYQRKGPGGTQGNSLKSFGIEAVSLLYNRHIIESNIGFISQSVYGQGFCNSVLGKPAMPVTDYLRRPEINRRKREPNVVLYNGAKGYSKVTELIPLLPHIEFRPIQNMTYQEVCEALASASAYVELGVPPGRDRLPREAIHFETPVVLLCRGAAYCWDDFPLPEKFRIPHDDDWATKMAPILDEVVSDPDQALREQSFFSTWVSEDRERYEKEIDNWLTAVMKRM